MGVSTVWWACLLCGGCVKDMMGVSTVWWACLQCGGRVCIGCDGRVCSVY